MNRRKFIKAGAFGLAGLSVLQSGLANCHVSLQADALVDSVKLGESGLTVSRIAMGTGTHGGNRSSDFTRMGLDRFTKLAHYAYERGIRFYDTAESYGSIPFTGNVIKSLPRKEITVLTKMWTFEDGSDRIESVSDNVNRYLKEFNTDYIDILLMHCMTDGQWGKNRTHYMNELSKAKQAGKIRTLGVSCHDIDALREAAVNPWVEVIMARINPFQTLMDGAPDEVNEILGVAKANGKGIIGMKIFGEGRNVLERERKQSINYALTEANIHCMTLGMISAAQIDDAIEKVNNTLKIIA
ncbi:MAG: aldo/keto reductase [Tannerella sp.]|nr:aldo/keto reductase [Tannerella sp.]